MLVKELLDGLSKHNERITVPVPEMGKGAEVVFRTRLSVSDVMSLPDNFPRMVPFAQNVVLFALLAREPNGQAVDLETTMAGDAIALHHIVERSGLREKVFAQLAGDEDDTSEADTSEKGVGKRD